jgi:hypothetical protein
MHDGHLRRGPAQHLGQGLAHQDERGQRGQGSEYRQRDGLRRDGLLDLAMNGVHAADLKRVAQAGT